MVDSRLFYHYEIYFSDIYLVYNIKLFTFTSSNKGQVFLLFLVYFINLFINTKLVILYIFIKTKQSWIKELHTKKAFR